MYHVTTAVLNLVLDSTAAVPFTMVKKFNQVKGYLVTFYHSKPLKK